MKKLYTINYDYDYVFYNHGDAVETASDLRQRFPDETFDIETINEDDPEFPTYEEYANLR